MLRWHSASPLRPDKVNVIWLDILLVVAGLTLLKRAIVGAWYSSRGPGLETCEMVRFRQLSGLSAS